MNDPKLTRALALAILAMKDALSEQREFRAHEPEKFDQVAFNSIYTAVNTLGYLDKDPK